MLAADGTIYSCGVNEKGTVPVRGLEPEGSIDEFTPIDIPARFTKDHGKVIQICAGGSFSAALTQRGSVIGWGNLRVRLSLSPALPTLQLLGCVGL